MTNFHDQVEIIAGIIAIVTGIVIFIRFLLKKQLGYLLYDIKKYKINDELIEILCIWNPTTKSVSKNEITKDFETTLDSNSSFQSVIYTSQHLKDLIRIENAKKNLKLVFSTFPAKSGCVYTAKSKERIFYGAIESLVKSGEINNHNISHQERFLFSNLFKIFARLVSSIFIILLMIVILPTSTTGFFILLFAVLFLTILSLIPTTVSSFLVFKKLGKLRDRFEGR